MGTCSDPPSCWDLAENCCTRILLFHLFIPFEREIIVVQDAFYKNQLGVVMAKEL